MEDHAPIEHIQKTAEKIVKNHPNNEFIPRRITPKITPDGFIEGDSLSQVGVAVYINLNVRFGKARLNHETADTETLSNRIEERLLNSSWINRIPLEKRYLVAGGIMTAANLGQGTIRKLTKGLPFVGILAGGLISGSFEYVRKRDEITESNSRLTRMLAEGRNPQEMLQKYNAQEIANNITINKVEDIKSNIERLKTAYETNKNPKNLESLLSEIARFQALYEVGKAKNTDLLGSTSLDELQKQRLATIDLCSTTLKNLSLTDPSIKDKYKAEVDHQMSYTESIVVNRDLQFRSLRNGIALRRAAQVAIIGTAAGLIGSEVMAHFKPGTTGLVEYLRGENTNAQTAQTSLTWLARWLKGDQASQYEQVTNHYFSTEPVTHSDTIDKVIGGDEAYKQLVGKSTLIENLTRTYTAQDVDQIHKYGGLTRSLWEGKLSGNLDIFGRNVIGGKDLLHDFDKSYLEAFHEGKFRAIVNLSDGQHVDVSSLISVNNGVAEIDLTKEPGIVGMIFKDGHEKGLEFIKNIQYGIGSGDKIDIVSTIDGAGNNFDPGPVHTQDVIEWTDYVKKDWFTHELKLNPQEIDDFYAVIFPSPKSGRIKAEETKTQESKPKNKPDNKPNTAPTAPSVPTAPTASLASTAPIETAPNAPIVPAGPATATASIAPSEPSSAELLNTQDMELLKNLLDTPTPGELNDSQKQGILKRITNSPKYKEIIEKIIKYQNKRKAIDILRNGFSREQVSEILNIIQKYKADEEFLRNLLDNPTPDQLSDEDFLRNLLETPIAPAGSTAESLDARDQELLRNLLDSPTPGELNESQKQGILKRILNSPKYKEIIEKLRKYQGKRRLKINWAEEKPSLIFYNSEGTEIPGAPTNTIEAAPSVTPPPVTPSIPTNTVEAERVVDTNEKEATLDTPEDIENAKNLVSFLGRLLNLVMSSRDRSLNGAQDKIDNQILPALKPVLDNLGVNIEMEELKEFFDNVTMDSEFTKSLRKILTVIYSPQGVNLKAKEKSILFTELFKKYVIKP